MKRIAPGATMKHGWRRTERIGRVKNENTARMAAAQNEADRLKNQNDARMAAAQTEADRLKRDSDAQMAAAQNEAIA